ncbi:hypothetical protein AB4Z52_14745 [Rhizobium sp. 2YAF20]|uniref:hypothetical protein n=1 Tax=Rhizobium sp. 2YAF20 TaxID=3233027 RepID=UPI003F9AF689
MDRVFPDDLPLYPEDLAICQRVYDALRQECGIEHDPAMCDLLAWHAITYYRRGVKDEAQLRHLAKSTMDQAQRQILSTGAGRLSD